MHSSTTHVGRTKTSLRAVGLVAAAALAISAAPASATSIQDESGQPFTGIFNASMLSGSAVFASSPGNVTCATSNGNGAITSAGSAGGPAGGKINALDFKTGTGNEPCPDTIPMTTHQDFQAIGPIGDPAWAGDAEWVSDNTGGTLNGTFTFSGVRIRAVFDTVTCDYVGNFLATGATTRQLQADLFNPDNTAGGTMEMRFQNEPLANLPVTAGCPLTANLSAFYVVTGGAFTPPTGIKIQIRENPPPGPGGGSAAAPAATLAQPSGASTQKKCKKGRKLRRGKCVKRKKKST
jgi:hypothetical protein